MIFLFWLNGPKLHIRQSAGKRKYRNKELKHTVMSVRCVNPSEIYFWRNPFKATKRSFWASFKTSSSKFLRRWSWDRFRDITELQKSRFPQLHTLRHQKWAADATRAGGCANLGWEGGGWVVVKAWDWAAERSHFYPCLCHWLPVGHWSHPALSPLAPTQNRNNIAQNRNNLALLRHWETSHCCPYNCFMLTKEKNMLCVCADHSHVPKVTPFWIVLCLIQQGNDSSKE